MTGKHFPSLLADCEPGPGRYPARMDEWFGRIVGHVRVLRGRKVLFEDHNMVVDASGEIIVRALLGTDIIKGVEFGRNGGIPITRGQRSLQAPVGFAAVGQTEETKAFLDKDEITGLRTIATWSAIFSPTASVTYDSLGLVSTTGLLFAAVSCPQVTLVPGSPIIVQWTIKYRGTGA